MWQIGKLSSTPVTADSRFLADDSLIELNLDFIILKTIFTIEKPIKM